MKWLSWRRFSVAAIGALFAVLAVDGWVGAQYWEAPLHASADPVPVHSSQRGDFRATPLPSTWITEGEPVTRSLPLISSIDKKYYSGLWDSQAGRFKYTYFVDEIVHILEGEVHIRDEAGRDITLRTGDVAHFAKGRVLQWHVPRYVKKLAVTRVTHDPLYVRAIRKLKRIFA